MIASIEYITRRYVLDWFLKMSFRNVIEFKAIFSYVYSRAIELIETKHITNDRIIHIVYGTYIDYASLHISSWIDLVKFLRELYAISVHFIGILLNLDGIAVLY